MKFALFRGLTAIFTAACICMSAAAVFAAETTTDTTEWETTTTTTTTCDPAFIEPVTTYSNLFRYYVQIVDEETLAPFPNVNVRMEKRYYTSDAAGHQILTGEAETVEAWNTSDENPHISACYSPSSEKPYKMFAVIDELPEGYSADGRAVGEFQIWGNRIEYEPRVTVLKLRREKYYYYEGFPITGTYSLEIAVFDFDTGELVPGLDCVVINDTTGEEVFRCTTSATETFVIPELEYRFENWEMRDAMHYTLHILNMPDNYIVHYMGRKDYQELLPYFVGQWEKGITYRRQTVELDCTDRAYDPFDDYDYTQPYFETASSTTTSATTTAAVTTEDTTAQTPQPTTASISVDLTTSAAASTETTTTSTAALSDLPQTGNNDPRGAFLFALSLGLTAVGTAAVLHRETE